MDLWGWSRKKSVLINLIVMTVLSLPCVLGFNILSGVTPLGMDIMGFEDFIVSNNILPLGALVYLLFCVTKYGWGWDNFYAEVNTGKGLKYPAWIKGYLKYVIPIAVLFIFIQGYVSIFSK